MNIFKDLESKEIQCVARSVSESAEYVAENRRLGVCGFKHSGLASFCYATGTYRTNVDPNKSKEEIEVRCVNDETMPIYTSEFYPLNFFNCPKVIFRRNGIEGLGRLIGFDYERKLCHIYRDRGDESAIDLMPSSDVCLLSNIEAWGK